jgi:hypothetical protein
MEVFGNEFFGSPICMQVGNTEDKQEEHFNLVLPSLVSPTGEASESPLPEVGTSKQEEQFTVGGANAPQKTIISL